MTTTAIDSSRRLIASDSRWSFEEDDEVFYVDDTGFDKIVSRAFGSLVCAGDARLIEDWRNWFMSPVVNMTAQPATERYDPQGEMKSIAISLVLRPEGRPLFSNGSHVLYEDYARFSGSGAYFAYECFAKNGCGKKSVKTASASDPFTGGEIKYFDFKLDETNAGWKPISLVDVHKQFLLRGMVMNMKTKTVKPIKDHPKFADGTSSARAFNLSAPTGQPARAWSDVEKQRFNEAMRIIIDRENGNR